MLAVQKIMIKKLIVLVLALVLISSFTVSADGNAQLVLTHTAAGQGETVEVDLLLKNNPGIASMILTLTYDKTALKLVAVEDRGILGTSIHGNDFDANQYKLCWANDTVKENYTSNGAIVTLSFEVSDTADYGVYPITVSYNNAQYDIFDVGLNPVDFQISNGSITVSDTPVIVISDFNSEDTVSFGIETAGAAEGEIVCAFYGDGLMSVQTYSATDDIDICVDADGVRFIKIMWWNLERLRPYCESIKLEL